MSSSEPLQVSHPKRYGSDLIEATGWNWIDIICHLDTVLNTLVLAFLSGILWQGTPPGENDEEMELKSKERGLASMSSFLDEKNRPLYQAKVEELACRGFRSGVLLDFWEELLMGAMAGFDAQRSLTNDVVRMAIIPRSRHGAGGKALASVWEEGVWPQSMVTHNWANTFAHLVGAILADALNENTYEDIAGQLASQASLSKVRQRLLKKGRLDATYWVCAFSVNQHASICAGFGPDPPKDTAAWHAWDKKRYDSVSMKEFPLCDCSQPKILSHMNPACELNKFDDMMFFLSNKISSFGHVIIVDKEFQVFFRAWCVAEIVEGHVLDIPPKIKVFSENAVHCNYDLLSVLDVRDCSASSETDKDFILQKIGDVEAFNLKLQQLVFSAEGYWDTGSGSGWFDETKGWVLPAGDMW